MNKEYIKYILRILNSNRDKFIIALQNNGYTYINNIPLNIILLQSFYNKDLNSGSNGEINLFTLEWFRKSILTKKHSNYNGALMWEEYFNLIHFLHYNEYKENNKGELILLEDSEELKKKNLTIIKDQILTSDKAIRDLVKDLIILDPKTNKYILKK